MVYIYLHLLFEKGLHLETRLHMFTGCYEIAGRKSDNTLNKVSGSKRCVLPPHVDHIHGMTGD